ncbi:MAG: NUDIX hydrolase [Chloroflexi bacterium]|nr:NUDIX hydrolase [Chloroflexota bacterium]
MKFELLKSEVTYEGRAFTVRRDHLLTPSGNTVKYDIIQHIGSVILIPIDSDGQIYFVRQYRHAAELELLELPAGTLEPNEPPIEAAAREIREETGMASANLKEIGSFYLAPGYSTELMHVFMATELTHDPLDPDADEYLSVEKMPLAEALHLAESGQMQDAKSLAALLLAKTYLM